MRSFFKQVFATITGLFIFSFIGVLFLIIFLSVSLARSLSEEETKLNLEENSILKLDFSSAINDKEKQDFFIDWMSGGINFNQSIGLERVLKTIEFAKNNPKIKGISIEPKVVSAGLTQIRDIREALLDFKESGKFVYAYSPFFTQGGYYLASVADSIFISQTSKIELKGLASEVIYYKDFGDKYGVEFNVIRHGKYKSFVEPYLTSQMSEENKFQISTYLNSIWGLVSEDIAESRNISLDSLQIYTNDLSGFFSEKSIQIGLADQMVFQDEYYDFLKNKIGQDLEDDIEFVGIGSIPAKKVFKKETSEDKIAVLYAEGPIFFGKADDKSIGNVSLIEQIREIKKEDDIKGLVLRVNSPGGDAVASEYIWRELKLLKEKIPVVISMGNYAASGGYYISSASDYIFANSATITGSIGVFGMIPTVKELANDNGIKSQQVTTHKNSFYGSPAGGLNPSFKEVVQHSIDDFYDLFLKRISDNLGISIEKVDSLAQGRVWTGKDALEVGLVNEIGGLKEAIQKTGNLSEIDDFDVVYYPKKKTKLEEITELLGKTKMGVFSEIIDENLTEEQQEILELLKTNQKEKFIIKAKSPFGYGF